MKVTFFDGPALQPVGDGSKFQVVAPFTFRVWPKGENSRDFTVPVGFVTDFASVPRVPIAYMLFGGRAPRSALAHDYLYATQAGKDFADDVFHAAMKTEGIDLFTRSVMFSAVHLFGQPAYDGHAKRREAILQANPERTP